MICPLLQFEPNPFHPPSSPLAAQAIHNHLFRHRDQQDHHHHQPIMSTFDRSTFRQRRAHFLDCCAAHQAGESRATTNHQTGPAELKSFSITSLSARAAKFLQQTSQPFSVSTSSMATAWPYCVRGRKETEDLIKNFKQERRRELDELGQRQSVSRFSKGSRLALQTTLLLQHQSHQKISNLKLQNLSDLHTICPKPFGARAAYKHNPTSPSLSKHSARLATTAAVRPSYVTVELETKKMSELIRMFEQGRTKELDEEDKNEKIERDAIEMSDAQNNVLEVKNYMKILAKTQDETVYSVLLPEKTELRK